ncbi:transcription factor PAR1-like [Herrania umbratica]|uniref:Transcription factor PAR1-like n=1 Tax=Herrania umbratica TaxID=108875 RepID=A0A6J1B239_9ROSI|nr:transcription factor PAR1-like [Herrania umbratica]
MKHMESRRCKEFSRVKWGRRTRRSDHGGGAGGGGRSARMKVKKLQRLIPGGKGLQPDRLFLRTADYILHLRLQVNVLQALSKIYQPSI